MPRNDCGPTPAQLQKLASVELNAKVPAEGQRRRFESTEISRQMQRRGIRPLSQSHRKSSAAQTKSTNKK